jgi:hypothetical protein
MYVPSQQLQGQLQTQQGVIADNGLQESNNNNSNNNDAHLNAK